MLVRDALEWLCHKRPLLYAQFSVARNNAMKILLLHLSDIHFRMRDNVVSSRARAIAASTFAKLRSTQAVFVIVSGDIAFSGAREEYDVASTFFQTLRNVFMEETESPIYFILSPGNHDCELTGDLSIRDAVINQVVQTDGNSTAPAMIEECIKVQANFAAFRHAWEADNKVYEDPLWVTYAFDIAGHKVLFDCLNVAWMSERQEKPGKLVFPVERYKSFASDLADIRILVLHHPLNWYSQSTHRPFRTLVRSLANIVITGHEHEQNFGENKDVESGQSIYIEGGALQTHDGAPGSSFNIIEIDFDDQQYACDLHAWDGELYAPQEVPAWQGYHPLSVRCRNDLPFVNEFCQQIDDPGAAFSHPGKQKISLSDIFVFPDLRRRAARAVKKKDVINAATLMDVKMLAGGVLVQGDEKTGKTSLIYHLLRRYHDNGLCPLLLEGSRLRENERELKQAISQAVARQYGKSGLVKFGQAPLARKIVFVDDFDVQRLTNTQRGRILDILRKEFGGLLLTVSNLFDLGDIISEEPIRPLAGCEKYELLEFGHKARFELIRKWSSLGDGSGRDSAETFKIMDSMEKSLNAIIGRNLVPRVPLYLLTLLQSLEINHTSELQNSAFGDCYRFLITGALVRAGIKPVEMQEYLEFCTRLSWKYCENETKELEERELAGYNDWFSANYHRRDFRARVDLLIECKILEQRGGCYAFRYPYAYYFFLGKYLSDNLGDVSIRERVIRYCKHLYVRDYANALLFLSHHCRDQFVYQNVVDVLRGLFFDKSPVEFNGDTAFLSDLVELAPKLVFKGGDVAENRSRVRALKDDISAEEGDIEDNNKEESTDHISLMSKLTLLFKTVEILGQILKNQYATISNNEKKRLLTEAFSGPLRALKEFFEGFGSGHDALISEIERIISGYDSEITDDKRKRLARDTAFFFISTVATSVIYKTALSVGSEYLKDVIAMVAEDVNTEAYLLIGLAVQLECRGSIPYTLIGKLKERTKDNAFAFQVLQRLVLNYLYMFKSKDKDKQKLCAMLGIPMATQRAIDLRTKNTKRLK